LFATGGKFAASVDDTARWLANISANFRKKFETVLIKISKCWEGTQKKDKPACPRFGKHPFEIAKILWAADEAVLKTVHKMKKSMPMIQSKK
jgi:hypothetical protein